MTRRRRRFGTPQLTRRGFGTLFVGIGASATGSALGIAEATTVGLLMLALWTFAAVHAIFRSAIRPGIRVQRIVAADTHLPFVGDDLTVDAVVVAERWSGIGEITEVAVDELSVRRGARSVRMAVRPLRRGEHATASYRVTLRERGTLRFLPSTWRRHDPLGLFRWTHQLGESSEVLVGPAVVDLGNEASDLLDALRPFAGTRRPVGTDPFELRELRPYVHGDDLRRVHWASSARRNELIVREPEVILTASRLPLHLAVDTRASQHQGTLELALSIAASLIVVSPLPVFITIATDDTIHRLSSIDKALAVLAAVARERAASTGRRQRRSNVDSEHVDGGVDGANVVISGPGFGSPRAPHQLVLAAGTAPFDARAWEPGDASRDAVSAAIMSLVRRAVNEHETAVDVASSELAS